MFIPTIVVYYMGALMGRTSIAPWSRVRSPKASFASNVPDKASLTLKTYGQSKQAASLGVPTAPTFYHDIGIGYKDIRQ